MYGIGMDFKTFQTNLYYMLEKWVVRQDDSFNRFRDDFSEMKASLQFFHQNYDALQTQTANVEARVNSLESRSKYFENWHILAKDSLQFTNKTNEELQMNMENINTRMALLESGTNSQNTQKVAFLEGKIELMEQQLWECNAEITNLVEERREDLMGILEIMSNIIEYKLNQRDIVSIHRDPQGKFKGNPPRAVFVKFASQLVRDTFISLARKRRGFNSLELNMPAQSRKVIVKEQVSEKVLTLLQQTRETAMKHDWEFVWMKHGTVLVRKGENTVIFPIHCAADLVKIK